LRQDWSFPGRLTAGAQFLVRGSIWSREPQVMLADGNQVTVAESMLANPAPVHEGAVRAAEVDQ
jgi:hypothetical protein